MDVFQIKRAEALSDVNIDQWIDAYGLKGKLRFAPGNPELINNHKVALAACRSDTDRVTNPVITRKCASFSILTLALCTYATG